MIDASPVFMVLVQLGAKTASVKLPVLLIIHQVVHLMMEFVYVRRLVMRN